MYKTSDELCEEILKSAGFGSAVKNFANATKRVAGGATLGTGLGLMKGVSANEKDPNASDSTKTMNVASSAIGGALAGGLLAGPVFGAAKKGVGKLFKSSAEKISAMDVPDEEEKKKMNNEIKEDELSAMDKKAFYKQALSIVNDTFEKIAGTEYGFTAYKDLDGSIKKKLIEADDNNEWADIDRDKKMYDWQIGKQIGKPVYSKVLPSIVIDTDTPGEDTPLSNFMFKGGNKKDRINLTDYYSNNKGGSAFLAGKESANEFGSILENDTMPRIKSRINNKKEIITSKEKELAELNDKKNSLRWYNFIQKPKTNRAIRENTELINKNKTRLSNDKLNLEAINNYKDVINASLANENNNLYEWRWY